MKAVLDTSVLIRRGFPAVADELAISAVSLAEIHFGVLVARTEEQRAARLRLLTSLARSFDALPVDDAVGASYGELAGAVFRVGPQPRVRVMDLLIAATAHAHGARLYTRNPQDLRGVEQFLEVVPVRG